MVRQYIGARYVTKIYENSLDPSSAEWQSGVTYEPLTMVTYNNSSYLSKKEVPGSVGDPASNPSYWVVTGAYNGQIASLQSQIDAINASLSLLNDRKFVFIGDSYMAATGLTPDKSFARKACTVLGLTENTDYWVSAVGGYGFSRPGQQFITLLQAITVGVDDSEITDVIVCGGANDQGYESSISTDIGTFATACKTRFPNAKLHLGFTDWTMGQGYYYNNMLIEWKKGAYNNGASFIDGIWMAQHNFSMKQSDGHPNNDGQTEIAKCLSQYILTGSITYPQYGYVSTALTADQDCTISASPGFSKVSGDMVSLSLLSCLFTLNTDVPMTAGAETAINAGSIYAGCFAGSTFGNVSYLAPCYIYKPDDTRISSFCQVVIVNKVIQITPYVPTSMTVHRVMLLSPTFINNYYDA